MYRNILHLRIDHFPVAVEQLRNASLRGRPVVICSRHSPRALIDSASPEARAEGVFEGQPLTLALKRCRGITILPPDNPLYDRAGRAIGKILDAYSPLIETGHRGRFFADMSGTARLLGGMENAASQLRREIKEKVRLSGTMGIGSNKLISGVAARAIARHGDLCRVPMGGEASFLAPLKVRLLPAVKHKTERELLAEFNIRHIRQLADISLTQLAAVFGKFGVILHRQALGIDNTPVLPAGARPFVLEETTLIEDTNDDAVLFEALYKLTERACRRLRDQHLLARTAWLHLRYSDGLDVTRRKKLQHPTVIDPLLFRILKPFFMKTGERRLRIRYLSLTLTDLFPPSNQIGLFDDAPAHSREENLVRALDRIRDKYGEGGIERGFNG